ncbi:hypothetical protein MJH12_20355 [bacterium]|nr:hypothetical protein [bacterium]
MQIFKKFQWMIFGIYLSSTLCFCDFFPHEDKWMMSILQSKSTVWSSRLMDVKFSLSRKKKIQVILVFSSSLYDYDRQWRKKVVRRMNLLFP